MGSCPFINTNPRKFERNGVMSDLTKETCAYGEICRVQNGCAQCKITKDDSDWRKEYIFGYTWNELKGKQTKGRKK